MNSLDNDPTRLTADGLREAVRERYATAACQATRACCGTPEAAQAAGACCDPAAKSAAVAAGAGCCG